MQAHLFGLIICCATAIVAARETIGTIFLLDNRSGSRVILYVRPATPFPGRSWSEVTIDPGQSNGFVLPCPDNYDVRIVYYPGNGTWEELGVDRIDLNRLAAEPDALYEVSLQHWRTYANGKIWDRAPHPVASKVPLEASSGRLILNFGETGGFVGHKPKNPIILP